MSYAADLFELFKNISNTSFREEETPEKRFGNEFENVLDQHCGGVTKTSEKPKTIRLNNHNKTSLMVQYGWTPSDMNPWRGYTGRGGFSYELDKLSNTGADYYVGITQGSFAICDESNRLVIVFPDIDESEIEPYGWIRPLSKSSVIEVSDYISPHSRRSDSE